MFSLDSGQIPEHCDYMFFVEAKCLILEWSAQHSSRH